MIRAPLERVSLPVGQVCEPRIEARNPLERPEERFRYIDISSVDNDRKAIVGAKELLGSEAPSRARQVVRTGDVLVSMTRPNLNAVAMVPCELDNEICSTGFCVLRPTAAINPRYLFQFTRTQAFVDRLTRLVSGQLYPAVTASQVRATPIPLPSLDEQKRIVTILDEALELRQLRDEADGRTAALVPAIFDEMFGDPRELERMRWPFVQLGSFASISYGLADRLDEGTTSAAGVRIITISNVALDGQLNLSVERYSTSGPDARAKARLESGDLLFNWRNGSSAHVGKTAIWEQNIDGEVLHVSFLLRIRVDPLNANAWYLWALLNKLRAVGFFQRSARFQVNTKFNASELRLLELPLPPLSLQEVFAERVAGTRAIEARQAKSRGRLDILEQALLERAFRGVL